MSKVIFKQGIEDPSTKLTLRDMLIPMFRHQRLALVTFSILFVASILVSWLWASRYYSANMQVVVEQDRSDPAVSAGQSAAVINNKPLTPDQISSEVALLQGQDMFRSVAQTCGLAEEKNWSPSNLLLPRDPARRKAALIEKAANSLGKGLKVEGEKASDVIDVKFAATGDPETPACVLQTLSKLYLDKHLQLRRPVGSMDFFAEQTDKYRRDLQEAETLLTSFTRDEGVAAPDVLLTNMGQQLTNSVGTLYQAREAVAADRERIREIEKQMAATPERISTQHVSSSANALMQQLQASLLAAEIKRTQLLVKYAPSYPLVQEADQEIRETNEAIVKARELAYVNETTDTNPTFEFLRQDAAKTRSDLASQEATAVAIERSISGMQVQMASLNTKAVKQAALLREAKADEGNYLLYLGKREQERTSDALDRRRIANVAIAVPAIVPALPAVSPVLVVFLGFLFAVVSGVSSAFLAEHLDPSFRNPQEVAKLLDMPVLAAVPRQAA
jgi:succinoglycan biosynthesis transport protein ExoP